ncbi:hypothetical protein GJ496_007557 [Pomphorhynchus laevis]|nr:hypothetical protein GJ496_007557 [Pomphorhynchus laevis]
MSELLKDSYVPAKFNEIQVKDVNVQMAANGFGNDCPMMIMDRIDSTDLNSRRLISLKEPVRVGRSVGKQKPSPENAIFECRVLSRHQAIIWFEHNMFFLKDTKSSNGTFVNSCRIEADDSFQIFTDDTLQFGIDVTEGNVKAHSCVIVQIKLAYPDGSFAASRSDKSISMECSNPNIVDLMILIEQLSKRELNLRARLYNIDQETTQLFEAIDARYEDVVTREDLLCRIGILENQVSLLRQNTNDLELKDELLKVNEQVYQQASAFRLEMVQLQTKYKQSEQDLEELKESKRKLEENLHLLQMSLHNQSMAKRETAHSPVCSDNIEIESAPMNKPVQQNDAAIQYEFDDLSADIAPHSIFDESNSDENNPLLTRDSDDDYDSVSLNTVCPNYPVHRVTYDRSCSPIAALSSTEFLNQKCECIDIGINTFVNVENEQSNKRGNFIFNSTGMILALLSAIILSSFGGLFSIWNLLVHSNNNE